jgi:hypothetical protein
VNGPVCNASHEYNRHALSSSDHYLRPLGDVDCCLSLINVHALATISTHGFLCPVWACLDIIGFTSISIYSYMWIDMNLTMSEQDLIGEGGGRVDRCEEGGAAWQHARCWRGGWAERVLNLGKSPMFYTC